MATPESLGQLSILLVEDEPADSTLLKAILRDEIQRGEVVIQTVRTLKLAYSELKRLSFACVLMDLGLPDSSGVDSVTRLLEADAETAIIVLTGLDNESAAQRAMQLGAQEYLVKGRYDAHELLRLIRLAVIRNQRVVELLRKAGIQGTNP